MNHVFFVISLLFLTGGLGIILINRKLPQAGKRKNRVKYFAYLIIVMIVAGSLILDKKIFIALMIIVNAVGIIEMMMVRAKSGLTSDGDHFLVISLSVYLVLILFFLQFALLPAEYILYTYVIVLVFDGASQITGQIAGRKKLIPEISPGKTLEGLIGGLVIAVATSVWIRQSVDYSVIRSLVWGFLICSAAFAGDMLASLYKRKFKTKDFSNILPGQGGMFDRFDSFVSAGAVAGIGGIPYFTNNPPDKNLTTYLLITYLFFMVLIAGETVQHFFRVKSEWIRMLSHFFAGIICLLFLDLFSSVWYVVAICIQSVLFLGATGILGFFESHHKVGRKTLGSPLFFAGILMAYFSSVWFDNKGLFILPVLILTISDPLAALAGMNFGTRHWKNYFTKKMSSKTLIGSMVYFVVSVIILYSCIPCFYGFPAAERIVLSLTVGLAATIAEASVSNGLDNLTIPGVVIILMFLV